MYNIQRKGPVTGSSHLENARICDIPKNDTLTAAMKQMKI